MASNGGGSCKKHQVAVMMVMCLIVPLATQAQSDRDVPGGSTGLGVIAHPPKEFEAVREIRTAQRQLARETRIAITEFDEHGRSSSIIYGVIPELRDLIVTNEQQLVDALIPGVYKYFGITGTGTEMLKSLGKTDLSGNPAYGFQEYINGIEVPAYFYVFVDAANKVINTNGEMDIDRGYDLVPAMPEQEALELARTFIRERDKRYGYSQNDPDNLAAIKAQVVYVHWHDFEGLRPAWQFEMPALDTSGPYLDKYTVFPNGQVEGGMRGM